MQHYLDSHRVDATRPLCLDCLHDKRDKIYETYDGPIFDIRRDKFREMLRKKALKKYETEFQESMGSLNQY